MRLAIFAIWYESHPARGFLRNFFAEDKLNALEPYQIWRIRHRQLKNVMNDTELKAFMCLTASIGWLCVSASPFCAFYSSLLEQKMTVRKIFALLAQSWALGTLKLW